MSFFIIIAQHSIVRLYVSAGGDAGVLQRAGYLLPVTFYLQIMRGIILKGIGIDMPGAGFCPCGIYRNCSDHQYQEIQQENSLDIEWQTQ